ncbi:hypothetical protein NC653_028774 [Populus alba x Populus x berolinensis]|uniref:Uncharacterized protein n=1 Tax=Populus alba x Populus x berolinensis TaxID=444605 RepID=A0AAD6Q3R4_9ROSI|nr:hypothetical protein NC653_028774 [Populus alba x Populus x berolinensis]
MEHLQENTQIGQIHLKYLEYKSENRIEDQPLNVQWIHGHLYLRHFNRQDSRNKGDSTSTRKNSTKKRNLEAKNY